MAVSDLSLAALTFTDRILSLTADFFKGLELTVRSVKQQSLKCFLNGLYRVYVFDAAREIWHDSRIPRATWVGL